ncbi:MAG: putative ABC exporter domain-containing protein [Candidatus Moduliflexus flocculans]|nr:putative ABC exporter domain-containing protein [Candidatus Moduliflexus flocculans]
MADATLAELKAHPELAAAGSSLEQIFLTATAGEPRDGRRVPVPDGVLVQEPAAAPAAAPARAEYIVGLVVGLLYFYVAFFRRNRRRRPVDDLPTVAALAGPVQLVASLFLFSAAVIAWVWPSGRPPLPFSRAEVQFLFTAPVSRRQLVHYKLWRSQFAILFGSAVATLILRPGSLSGGWTLMAGDLWPVPGDAAPAPDGRGAQAPQPGVPRRARRRAAVAAARRCRRRHRRAGEGDGRRVAGCRHRSRTEGPCSRSCSGWPGRGRCRRSCGRSRRWSACRRPPRPPPLVCPARRARHPRAELRLGAACRTRRSRRRRPSTPSGRRRRAPRPVRW